MSNVSKKKTDINDDISPDDSASNVSGTTHTSTRYVHDAQKRAAAEAAARLLEEKHQLEMTIVELEDENYLAEIQEKNKARLRKLDLEKQRKQRRIQEEEEETRRLQEEADRELETERAARARRRRMKQAEMSMKEFQARANALTGKAESNQNEIQSMVSSVTARNSIASVLFKHATDETKNQELTNESEETIKDCTAMEGGAGPTKIGMGVSKLDVNHALQTEQVTQNQFSSTSIQDRRWLNEHLQTLDMSPLASTSRKEKKPFSTLQPTTSSNEIIMKGNLAATTTSAPTTTTYATVTASSRPLQIHGNRFNENVQAGTQMLQAVSNQQTGYLPPLQHQSAPAIPQNEIATAIQQLASSNEIASLPKSELLTFDSSSKNYNRFMASFKVNIENKKSIDDTTKLTYLIQYCEGESRSLIENCIIMNSTE